MEDVTALAEAVGLRLPPERIELLKQGRLDMARQAQRLLKLLTPSNEPGPLDLRDLREEPN